jgi:hypothetical protein
MASPNSVRPGPICRRCRAPVALAAEFCPRCGAADPCGFKMAQVGSLIYGGLIAAAVTGLYAWVMHSDWERWDRKIRSLPADHVLADAPWETAAGIGVAILLFTWVSACYLLSRFVRERAQPWMK